MSDTYYDSDSDDSNSDFSVDENSDLRSLYKEAADKIKSYSDEDESTSDKIKSIINEYQIKVYELDKDGSYCFGHLGGLDKEYFNTTGGGFWRRSYNNPWIGDILTPELFGGRKYIVTESGIMTFNMEPLA